jgi:hypothetical protein
MGITTNLAVVNWGEFCLRLALATPNLEWICIVVPFALWDLRIEGCNVHFLPLRGRVTSETCRIQACLIRYVFSTTFGQSPYPNKKRQLTEAFGKPRTISTLNSLAQSFNRWQYLLGQIIIVICCARRQSDPETNTSNGEYVKERMHYLSDSPHPPS